MDNQEVSMSNTTEKFNENIDVYFSEDSQSKKKVPVRRSETFETNQLKLFLVNIYDERQKVTSTTQIHE